MLANVRALWVGGTGTLALAQAGTAVSFGTVNAGTWLDIAPTKVLATGTTATSIIAIL